MKKAMVLILILMAGCLFCSDFLVFLDFNYSQGLSSFFKMDKNLTAINGNPGLEKIKNWIGMGFKLGMKVPLIKDFSLIPSVALNFGHQKYDFFPDDIKTDAIHQTYYFHNWAGALDLAYTYLRLKNGWDLYAQTGLSLNFISGDKAIGFEKSSYLGWQAGLGFAFRQLKNFGFHTLVIFKTLFTSEKISFLGIDAGLFYKI